MPWDVFISHASEDKEAVALPLKRALEQAGFSCWIDQEQISLGGGLPRRIDAGLARSSFTVVIASPSYFTKAWTRKEMDAAVARDVTRRTETVLVVLHEMTIKELQDESPMTAVLLAVPWTQGISRVVVQIAGAIRGEAPAVFENIAPSQSAMFDQSRKRAASVLILLPDGTAHIYEERSTTLSGSSIEARIWCRDPKDSAMLNRLSREQRVAIAYGTTAVEAQIEKVIRSRTDGIEEGSILARVEPDQHGYGMEFSYNGHSAEQIAELRARRILLNELTPSSGRGFPREVLDTVFDTFISGQGFVTIPESPLPRLRHAFPDDDSFLDAARLMAVLCLRLSGVVEHVLKLDLTLLHSTRLRVSFEGQRHQRFTNVPPYVIKVDGECDLAAQPRRAS